jgi:hypothetical protein
VGVRKADVKEEGRLPLGLAIDVLHRCLGDVALHLPTVLHGVGAHLPQVSARIGFPDAGLGRGDDRFWHPGALHAVAIQGAVGRLDNAYMVLVEALTGWPALLTRSEMPLADDAGGVSLALEQFTQGYFVGLQGVRRAPMMMVLRPKRCE